jgi:UDP-hydrolysing UDP-N-acetyl-D-glucosamine 2-epimerase
MTSVAVITVARSDFSILLPVISAIRRDPVLKLRLIATGAHLSPEFGATAGEIAAAGFTIDDRVEMLLSSDSPAGTAKSIGLGVLGFAQLFASRAPDVLLLMGDRFEMFAAAAAALPFGITVVHIHGGEITEGAFDDSLRHAITKLSHLHLVATEEYARRVVQLGEMPDRVVWCGAPALDLLRGFVPLSIGELSARIGLPLVPAPLVVTYHPVTHEPERTEVDVSQLLDALDDDGGSVVITAPNADPQGRLVRRLIEIRTDTRKNWKLVHNLGTEAYFSLMHHAAAMVGNSSSGIIEAASFGLPVVNVGSRQKGRVRAANVLDVAPDRRAIRDAIAMARSPSFRARLRGQPNPYDRGGATTRILDAIRSVSERSDMRVKRFHDLARTGDRT